MQQWYFIPGQPKTGEPEMKEASRSGVGILTIVGRRRRAGPTPHHKMVPNPNPFATSSRQIHRWQIPRSTSPTIHETVRRPGEETNPRVDNDIIPNGGSMGDSLPRSCSHHSSTTPPPPIPIHHQRGHSSMHHTVGLTTRLGVHGTHWHFAMGLGNQWG